VIEGVRDAGAARELEPNGETVADAGHLPVRRWDVEVGAVGGQVGEQAEVFGQAVGIDQVQWSLTQAWQAMSASPNEVY
jgi:hypothetical protein